MFTISITFFLETIDKLYSLSLNDSGLTTLEGFPRLPSLIRVL